MNSPDCWQIVKINSETPHYRVLCAFMGGYLGGDAWQLSSGIEEVEETETHYVMPQTSGSVYKLHKHSERMSGIMSSVWNRLVSQQDENVTIELVSIEKFLEDWKCLSNQSAAGN